MKTSNEIFNEIYEEAKLDENIIGFFLGGSRGKGRENPYSDYDTYIIVKDEVVNEYKEKYPFEKYEGLDLIVLTLTELKKCGDWYTGERFERYTFAHIKALLDKKSEIQKILEKKARIPEKELHDYIAKSIDAYINFFYRSLKCLRDGDLPAARLEAAYSIPYFLNTIFAIHRGRLNPYYKYLRWELEEFPLTKFPMQPNEIIETLMNMLETADLKIQQNLMRITEEMCREEGYGFQFDDWGEKYQWMINFKLEDKD
ncbi:MAG: nucleotidyltransferase domain-containing protein [Promethearchaeota archaeon]